MKLRERRAPSLVVNEQLDLNLASSRQSGKAPKQIKKSFWSKTEKRQLITALKTEIALNKKLSTSATWKARVDISELQRLVPTRSQNEITEFIESCISTEEEKQKLEKEKFICSNVNKWIELCAKCQSRPPIVSYDGKLSPDVACCYSTLFEQPVDAVTYGKSPDPAPKLPEQSTSEVGDSKSVSSSVADKPSYSVVNDVLADWFTANKSSPNLLEKLRPTDALVLVQLIDDLEGRVQSGMSGIQEDHLFNLYQSLKSTPVLRADNTDTTNKSFPKESVSSPYHSHALNPLRFDESSCHVAHSAVPMVPKKSAGNSTKKAD